MKWFYKSIRALIVTSIILALTIPLALYITLTTDSVQNKIKSLAEDRLSELIDMSVSIGNVDIIPFNRVSLKNISISDSLNNPVIEIDRLGGAIDLTSLIFKRKLIFNYAELIGMDARLSRATPDSPLNIQPIIDALSPKEQKKSNEFNLKINTIVVRKSSLSYDVLSEAQDSLKFSTSHIALSDIRADLRFPLISDKGFNIILRRLAFSEQNGLRITTMGGEFLWSKESICLKGFYLQLPNSRIAFSDINIDTNNKNIDNALNEKPLPVELLNGSHLYLPDLAAFVPFFKEELIDFDISSSFYINSKYLSIERLSLFSPQNNILFSAEGYLDFTEKGMILPFKQLDLSKFELNLPGSDLKYILSKVRKEEIKEPLDIILDNAGTLSLNGNLNVSSDHGSVSGTFSCDAGSITFNSDISAEVSPALTSYQGTASLSMPEFNVGTLFNGSNNLLSDIGNIGGSINSSYKIGKDTIAALELNLEKIEYRGLTFSDIDLDATVDGSNYTMNFTSDNRGLAVEMFAELHKTSPLSRIKSELTVNDFDYTLFSRKITNEPSRLSGYINLDLQGNNIDDFTGNININDISISTKKKLLSFNEIRIVSERDSTENRLFLRSDIADGELIGKYSLTSLIDDVKYMVLSLTPTLYPGGNLSLRDKNLHPDSARLHITVKSTEPLGDPYDLPIAIIYPVEISGFLNNQNKELSLSINAPYLQQKGKLLENSNINILLKEEYGNPAGTFSLTTLYPTKKGPLSLNIETYATDNEIDSKLAWKVDRERDFHGALDLTTLIQRNEESNKIAYKFRINPSEMVFNDTVWHVNPCNVSYANNQINIDNFRVGRENQYIRINGKISESEKDQLNLSLKDVNLDYIFETLDIEKAMFGGIATGEFHASSILSPKPQFYTEGLNVAALKYNNSLMGNANIISNWDQVNKAVNIEATINQPNELKSIVKGQIFPFADSLDFRFDADKIEVGFMLPYMNAFTSEVSGYASGKARLWGNFKYIDMTGIIYAEDVKIKLDFTNTSYLATDTVVLTPGHIALDNITLRDTEGKTALLNGYIDHEYFKQPRFEFKITDAQDLLVYDIKDSPEARWYGKIYGNGSALVTGYPGTVNIGVNMSTAPRSSFTFVLSDAEEAYEYNFITFRDRDQAKKDSIKALNAPPPIIKELKDRISQSEDQGTGSVYNMNISVDVNPSANVTIVMDPVGGDKIRANGEGHIRMTYESANEDFKMYGAYTLDRGDYNFTLQDIIIKDFTIREGSTITFQGDPYAATLDIEAVYSINANLSDLDESFLQDKELNRTKVPVHALLLVKGDIRQPDISFDLEFPTLTQDTYRKVRSIVSTEEMMNQQIIYLLALSRFYTPDYMTTTKGNEFVSVASSTISSQLSNILGQLSDNWSISPNFRSDKGDFSDVEVDLALSSRLLNNRLLLNGNFGYRDKSLNNNTFIGDFDVEYLLNRTGSIRLKAYNRYNDRNYYLKSALTTQGVGVVFKKDFDNVFSFLKHNSKKGKTSVDIEQVNDSGPTLIIPPIKIGNDSIPGDTILNRGRFEVNLDNL
ncbi:MAG: translocation/assembly module TamB domain-containing protein [Paramuribaculum sp.]|nr:translocation/assembly module TamB domain-containing protein [Paramuribaculum sp.]